MRKNNTNRWKKITALLLSAAMTIPMAPGAVYAAEDPNSAAVIEEAVMPEEQAVSTETDTPDSPGESGEVTPSAPHEHRWDYSNISSGNVSATISCSETTCTSGNVTLTLISGNELNAPYVQVSGNELPHENEWGIKYTIRYVADGVETDAPPEAPGSYKVRAYFGDGTEHYLEIDHVVGPKHEHHWDYSSIISGNVSGDIICSSWNQDPSCPSPSGNMHLELIVDKDRDDVYVQANGDIRLQTDDEWGILDKIVYVDENGTEICTEPERPKEAGTYRVRAYFKGEGQEHYLQNDHEVPHKHGNWIYEKIDENTVKVTCSGNGACEYSTEGIKITLNVEERSEYVEGGKERVTLSANSQSGIIDPATLKEGLGIGYNLVYYKDANGQPDGPATEQPPQNAGTYQVRVTFGDGADVALEQTFTIDPRVVSSNRALAMKSYVYGNTKATGPSLNNAVGIKIIEYCYYIKGQENIYKIQDGSAKFNATFLKAGKYEVLVRFKLVNNENRIYETKKKEFTVNRGVRSVTMKSYGKDCPNKPELISNIKENPRITYSYKIKNGKRWTKQTKWITGKTNESLKSGTYQMQVKVAATTNYQALSKTITFTVYEDHIWAGMPKKLIKNKEQTLTAKCSYCKKVQKVTLPKEMRIVTMGKSAKLVSKGTGCTFTTKVKGNYFTLKKGKIITKANPKYYRNMKTSIPVTVKACGKTYTIYVKLQIPASKVTIRTEKITLGGVTGRKFRFQYDIPGADKITVNMDGQTDKIRQELASYVSGSKSTSDSYINLSDGFLQNLQTVKNDKKVIFKITAHYGKNRSKTWPVSVNIQ